MLDCWLTALSLLWGMCIWTFLGSIVTTLLIHLNAASSEYTAKITALNQYMAHRKLPQVHDVSPDHSSCNVVNRPGPYQLFCDELQVSVTQRRARTSRSLQKSREGLGGVALPGNVRAAQAASHWWSYAPELSRRSCAGAAAAHPGQLRGALEGGEAL